MKDVMLHLEHVPFRWNRDMLQSRCVAHVLVGKPVSTLPEHALGPEIRDGRERVAMRIKHFRLASIDNENTRRACGRAPASLFALVEDGGWKRLRDIGPLDVHDYLEAAKGQGFSTAAPKQHMAGVRVPFGPRGTR